MEGEQQAQVIALRREGHEYINGTQLALGAMALTELHSLEADAEARMVDAAVDVQIIRDYIDRCYPENGGAA